MFEKISSLYTRKRVIWVVLAAIVIWIVGGSLWYTKVYMDKERRFWTAIENGLRTTSVTKEVSSTSASASQTQLSRMRLGPQAVVEGKTIVSQKGSDNTSTVITSNLVTPTEGFIRYDKIETSEKNSSGNAFDFSQVIGQWASQDGAEQEDGAHAQAFAESFIQLIPIGNLDTKARKEVMKALKDQKAYELDLKNVEEDKDAHLTMYTVTLNTRNYVGILQDIFRRQGLAELSALDPQQYDAAGQITLKIGIDSGNTVRRVGFSEEEYESYSGYGLTNEVALPKDTITYTELQTRLQAAQ